MAHQDPPQVPIQRKALPVPGVYAYEVEMSAMPALIIGHPEASRLDLRGDIDGDHERERLLAEAGNWLGPTNLMRQFNISQDDIDIGARLDRELHERAERAEAQRRILDRANEYYGRVELSSASSRQFFDISMVQAPAMTPITFPNQLEYPRKVTRQDIDKIQDEIKELYEILSRQNELIQKLLRDKQGINITELI